MALQFDDFQKMREIFQDEELDTERKQRQETQRRKLALQERKLQLQERKQEHAERKQEQKESGAGRGLWIWTFSVLGCLFIQFLVLLIILLKY